jgi:tetratricopeptide (TPR) repeat protein
VKGPRPMIGRRWRAMLTAMLCVGVGTRAVAQNRGTSAAPPPPCPDATDTRELLDYYIGFAYRAHISDPAHRLPAPCLVLAIAKSPAAYRDSTVMRTLVLSEGLLRAQPDDPALLNAHLVLLHRLGRYGDVRAAFDALATRDSSRITPYAYKIAIGSARRDADTAAMLRYLTAATGQFPASAQFSAEYGILRQVGRLRAAIDTVHRAMKADPRRTGGYASLVSIYGNLEQPDSAFAYIHKGLAAHAPRQELAMALRSLVGALLRHAQIVDAPDVWEATLPIAFAADSVLSTPDTKYLVALSISHVVYSRIDTLNFYLPDVRLGADRAGFQSIDVTRVPQSSADAECPSIAVVLQLIATAKERLASGGSRIAPETVPAIAAALNAVAERVAPLQRGCV